jgi:hypothetical protein
MLNGKYKPTDFHYIWNCSYSYHSEEFKMIKHKSIKGDCMSHDDCAWRDRSRRSYWCIPGTIKVYYIFGDFDQVFSEEK